MGSQWVPNRHSTSASASTSASGSSTGGGGRAQEPTVLQKPVDLRPFREALCAHAAAQIDKLLAAKEAKASNSSDSKQNGDNTKMDTTADDSKATAQEQSASSQQQQQQQQLSAFAHLPWYPLVGHIRTLADKETWLTNFRTGLEQSTHMDPFRSMCRYASLFGMDASLYVALLRTAATRSKLWSNLQQAAMKKQVPIPEFRVSRKSHRQVRRQTECYDH